MKKINIVSGIIALCILSNAEQIRAQNPEMEWARQMGGAGWNAGTAVASDGLGNVYTTGAYEGTADFSLGAGTAVFTVTGRHIFISKLNAQGNYVWAKTIGISGTNQGMAIKADEVGNVYIAGQFVRSPSFNAASVNDTLMAVGGTDAFVMKLNPAGEFVWAKNVGLVLPTGQKIAYGMALDAGHVYITGEAGGEVFASKIDTSGGFVWTKTWGGNKSEYSYAIAVDDSGNVYTTGKFSSDSVDFDPGAGTYYIRNSVIGSSSYTYHAFVSKLDPDGNFLWAKGFINASEGNGIGVDKSGNVYASGVFRNTVDFNPGSTPNTMTAQGSQDGYICKYSSAGNLIWTRQMGGAGVVNPRSLAIDGKAHVYISGWFSSWGDFDPASGAADTFKLYTKGSNDIYIASLDSSGSFVWAKGFGSTTADYGYAISVDKKRSVYGAGYFGGDIHFDPTVPGTDFKGLGSQDVYVLKINQFCIDTSSSLLDLAICDDEYSINEETYTESGTYTQNFINASGCDSILTIVLDLKGKLEHPVINVDVFVLSTTIPYQSYQWFLNGNIIQGATTRAITVTENGDYQVAVTNEGGCVDTSDIYTVTNITGIDPVYLSNAIRIYPNPATDVVTIIAPVNDLSVSIKAIDGRVVRQVNNTKNISVKELSAGLYVIEIKDKEGYTIKTEKIIKE